MYEDSSHRCEDPVMFRESLRLIRVARWMLIVVDSMCAQKEMQQSRDNERIAAQYKMR